MDIEIEIVKNRREEIAEIVCDAILRAPERAERLERMSIDVMYKRLKDLITQIMKLERYAQLREIFNEENGTGNVQNSLSRNSILSFAGIIVKTLPQFSEKAIKESGIVGSEYLINGEINLANLPAGDTFVDLRDSEQVAQLILEIKGIVRGLLLHLDAEILVGLLKNISHQNLSKALPEYPDFSEILKIIINSLKDTLNSLVRSENHVQIMNTALDMGGVTSTQRSQTEELESYTHLISGIHTLTPYYITCVEFLKESDPNLTSGEISAIIAKSAPNLFMRLMNSPQNPFITFNHLVGSPYNLFRKVIRYDQGNKRLSLISEDEFKEEVNLAIIELSDLELDYIQKGLYIPYEVFSCPAGAGVNGKTNFLYQYLELIEAVVKLRYINQT